MSQETIELLQHRRTQRSFAFRPIEAQHKSDIVAATLRAPTAGNMMLYSVIEVTEQGRKERLAKLCDNQPMIAKAPMVWLFVADLRKWVTYYQEAGSVEKGKELGIRFRNPGPGDLLLAISDALIAAQTAVIAAQALGIGSCYIGDILEHYEEIASLFELPRYSAPATLLIFGYPRNSKPSAKPSIRCPEEFIFMQNRYKEFHLNELSIAYGEQEKRMREQQRLPYNNTGSIADYYYLRKHTSAFMEEMNRSVKAMIAAWTSASE